MRATLEQVLTEEAFERHDRRWPTRVHRRRAGRPSTSTGVPWSVSQLGARAEYRFASPAPRTGTESAAAGDDELDEYLHLSMANRGRPHHAVPQHGPDVPGHHAGRRRPAHRLFARGRRRARRLTPERTHHSHSPAPRTSFTRIPASPPPRRSRVTITPAAPRPLPHPPSLPHPSCSPTSLITPHLPRGSSSLIAFVLLSGASGHVLP